MNKLGIREGKPSAQGHTACKRKTLASRPEWRLPAALREQVQGCISGGGLLSPPSVSGGRARPLGPRPLRFREEQKKQRWSGGPGRPQGLGWQVHSFPRKPPSLPNVLPGMTRGRGGSRFRVSPAQRAEPGFLSIEVGGLVQPKLCTQERPSSRRQPHTPVSSAAPPPAAAFPQSQVQQLCGRGTVPTLRGLVGNGRHREVRTLGCVTQQ